MLVIHNITQALSFSFGHPGLSIEQGPSFNFAQGAPSQESDFPQEMPHSSHKQDLDQISELWRLGRTPIKIGVLKNMLRAYPHAGVAKELYEGFLCGFRLKYSGPRISFISKNLQSANCHKVETLDKLDQEVKAGRMAGPFLEKPISTLRTSPIGLVPKEKGWRLISHLSYPEGSGVNDFIDRDECSVQYASFDEVIQMVSSLGKSALIGVRDIKSAFRLLPVHPSDFELLGIYFDEKFFVNKSPEDTPVCQMMLDTFSDICEELGVPIASEKSVGPVTSLKFLGLVIDTVEMVVRIPQDKLLKLKSLLEPILLNKKITHKDLESVVVEEIPGTSTGAESVPENNPEEFRDLILSLKQTD
ncbi:Hypothetical predicted protein [Mytilus galloprovincialis]|uniref:Reverse transcriptase domain-containing protein n=1 Tax=Mytilus galloprovincialis TaxID=29158 RepID=A0A8B6D5V8_MYTGA|nr:Hypothetical predicted protein [Mytilus galloprovincialis]